jgi:hypothetical protein
MSFGNPFEHPTPNIEKEVTLSTSSQEAVRLREDIAPIDVRILKIDSKNEEREALSEKMDEDGLNH